MPAIKLGEPCWDKENVEQVFKKIGIARTDEEGVDYFLASHAPIQNVRDDKTGEELHEESLFQTLLNSKKDVQAVIYGDVGTGKSHLIHWLKLRTEDGLRRGEIKKIVPLLIERRKGTLKDALEQMIEQLGEDFKHHLSHVREALSQISSDTAREKLIGIIGLELRQQQRADKKREPLPRILKDLSEVCRGSQGFREWLCRENGRADEIVKYLTEKKIPDIDDIEIEHKLPQFTAAELLPEVKYRKPQDNIQVVRDLLDEFDFEPELIEEAVKFFNEVLPDAVKEMTGLAGTSLKDIFDRIRVDLKKRGETLALFIEDVSMMAVLDEEVFAAVEPQFRKDLCQMIAVVGTAEEVWNRIPNNQRQRVTHPISLSNKAVADWKTDTQAVAQFAARYFNTVRLTREQISFVASYRRKEGEDINLSACDHCPVREECHAKFGKTEIGNNVEVGLFPFTILTPKQFLNHIRNKQITPENARGLLRILERVLNEGYESLQSRKFPNPKKLIDVSFPEIYFWSGFKQMYCGNWTDESEINRLEFLAKGWVQADSADDLARKLTPFLEPFGFRQFSKATKVTKIVDEVKLPIHTKPVEPATNTKLNKILQSLKDWINKEKLYPDVEPRQLLAGLIRKSISWNDFIAPPLEERRKVFGSTLDDEVTTPTSGHAFVYIEGQNSEPATVSLFIKFPRNEETRSLIEALAQFTHTGNNSWNFEHGEYHKRITAQWLRRNQTQIIEQLQPPNNLDVTVPLTAAAQILSMAAIVRQRTKLSSELPELLKTILDDNWIDDPFALSNEWKSLVNDMKLRHKDLLLFLTKELNVPQGKGGVNFINAVPALNAALNFATDPKIEIPGEKYYQGFWKSRYALFQNKSKYNNFLEVLGAEREAIDEVLNNIRFNLRSVEYDTDNLPNALSEFCSDLNELVKAQTDAKMPYHYPAFDDMKTKKVFSEKKDVWQTAVKTAQEVISSNEIMSVLRFNPQNLKEADIAIEIATKYISLVEKDVASHQERFEKEGDPDELSANLLSSLERIEAMRS